MQLFFPPHDDRTLETFTLVGVLVPRSSTLTQHWWRRNAPDFCSCWYIVFNFTFFYILHSVYNVTILFSLIIILQLSDVWVLRLWDSSLLGCWAVSLDKLFLTFRKLLPSSSGSSSPRSVCWTVRGTPCVMQPAHLLSSSSPVITICIVTFNAKSFAFYQYTIGVFMCSM